MAFYAVEVNLFRAVRAVAIASLVDPMIGCVVSVNKRAAARWISMPFFGIAEGGGVVGAVRCFLAYWATMLAAGLFILLVIAALQNAAALFNYRFFCRISGFLQLTAFFSILALFFLTPPLANPVALSSPASQRLLSWLPSFWFLGLFHQLSGTADPVLAHLALRGVLNLMIASLFTLSMAALTYRRSMRGIVEQPDIAPSPSRGILSRLISAITLRLLTDPIERAILAFSARTLARSRQHRLLMAVYLGIAFAISLAYAKSLFYQTGGQAWSQPNIPMLSASLVMLFFAVSGMRAVFSLPFALSANWIFRISAVRSPASYFSAARKTLFRLSVLPVLLGSAGFYLDFWPSLPTLQHLALLALLGVL